MSPMVGSADGFNLKVEGSELGLVIDGTPLTPAEAHALADLLIEAANLDQVPHRRHVGTAGHLHVVRWPYHVTLGEHPRDPFHGGTKLNGQQTMQLAQTIIGVAGAPAVQPPAVDGDETADDAELLNAQPPDPTMAKHTIPPRDRA